MPSAHEGLNQVKSPILLPANPRWSVGDLIISLDEATSPLPRSQRPLNDRKYELFLTLADLIHRAGARFGLLSTASMD